SCSTTSCSFRCLPSWHPPAPLVASEHRIGTVRSPRPGPVDFWWSGRAPEVDDRVEDLPGEFHLSLPWEQWRVSEQHIKDEALIGLRGVLGESRAVGEVHRDVADLHRGTRHLGTEADRHSLVGLDSNDDGVAAQVAGLSFVEGKVGGAAEDDGD